MNTSSNPGFSNIVMPWREFQRLHQTRSKLLRHVLTVPLFNFAGIAGLTLALISGITVSWRVLAQARVLLISQYISHKKLEHKLLPPMTDLREIFRCFLTEQYLSWPRAFLSGTIVRLWHSESKA